MSTTWTEDYPAPGSARARYLRVHGERCEKCGKAWKLRFLRLHPRIGPREQDAVSDIMLLCSGCHRNVRARFELKLFEDEIVVGAGRTIYLPGAAHGADPYRYPRDHPASLSWRPPPSLAKRRKKIVQPGKPGRPQRQFGAR